MKTRSFTILLIAAIACVALGLFLDRGGDTTAASASTGQKFFPELVVNDVVEVTVAGAEAGGDALDEDPAAPQVESFVIKKEGESWGAAGKGGYPVDVGKLKQLVLALSEMRIAAEMTKKPDFYKKLGVQEITEPEATSKRVTLKDKGGKVVADVLVGNAKTTQSFGGKPALYVRKVGEPQAFEVTGQLTVSADASSWLDREVTKLESARVRRVLTTHADGTQLAVSKTTAEDKNFAVEALPEGKELMWEGVANGIGGALQYLNLEDVQPSEGFDMSGATITEFVTYDGMVVTAKSIERDGKTWMALSAAFDESQIKEEATVPPPPAEGAEPAPLEPAKPARKSPDEVKTEVEKLNQKVGAWVYAVPGYTGANFRKKLDDLLKKDEPPPTEEADAALEDVLQVDEQPPSVPPTPPAAPPTDDPHQSHGGG